MKVYIAKVSGNWGFAAGADRDDIIEFEMQDDATPEQIDKMAQEMCWEWFCNYAECSAYDITPKPDPADPDK